MQGNFVAACLKYLLNVTVDGAPVIMKTFCIWAKLKYSFSVSMMICVMKKLIVLLPVAVGKLHDGDLHSVGWCEGP